MSSPKRHKSRRLALNPPPPIATPIVSTVFALAGYTLLPGYSYRNMWWVSHNALGVFEGRGIHGQRLYVAPKAELVIARFCSHPIASSAANDPVTLPAFAAMSHLLMTG